MSRLVSGVVALMLGACATPAPEAPRVTELNWLPADVRPEVLQELLGSAWVRRLNSATGWVVIGENITEFVIPPTSAPPRVAREDGVVIVAEGPSIYDRSIALPEAERDYSCLDDLTIHAGAQAREVYQIEESYWLKEFLPGNAAQWANRRESRACWFLRDARLVQSSFAAAPPVVAELRTHGQPNEMFSIEVAFVYPGRFSAGVKPGPDGTVFWEEVSIRESDASLKPGTIIDTVVQSRWRNDDPTVRAGQPQPLPSEKTCRIEEWRDVGSGANRMPFQAARIGCIYVGEKNWDRVQWSWVVPELGLHLRDVFGRGELKVERQAEGRWRLSAPQSANSAFSMIVLDPDAAAKWRAQKQ